MVIKDKREKYQLRIYMKKSSWSILLNHSSEIIHFNQQKSQSQIAYKSNFNYDQAFLANNRNDTKNPKRPRHRTAKNPSLRISEQPSKNSAAQ